MNRYTQLEKLESDIEKALDNWDERSQFKLGKVRNLSRADLDTLMLYCDVIRMNGTHKGVLMNPLGYVGEVLRNYNLITTGGMS